MVGVSCFLLSFYSDFGLCPTLLLYVIPLRLQSLDVNFLLAEMVDANLALMRRDTHLKGAIQIVALLLLKIYFVPMELGWMDSFLFYQYFASTRL